MVDKVKENYLRRQAARLGLALRKSRGNKWSVNNQLGYMLTDPNTNTIIQGQQFELTLQGVENILNEQEKTMKQ